MVSGSNNNLITIWEIETGECFITFNAHTNKICCIIRLNSKLFISTSIDDSIKVWNFDRGLSKLECLRTIYGKFNYFICIIKLNRYQIASGGMDNSVIIWNLF